MELFWTVLWYLGVGLLAYKVIAVVVYFLLRGLDPHGDVELVALWVALTWPISLPSLLLDKDK
jgi:hypothetical protein